MGNETLAKLAIFFAKLIIYSTKVIVTTQHRYSDPYAQLSSYENDCQDLREELDGILKDATKT